MSQFDFDLFVIGAGSGGVRASRTAARMGARVAVAEERYLGGTCVNVGCIPKKLFVYGSEFSAAFADAQGFGWQTPTVPFDWPVLLSNKDKEITRLNGVYQRLLESSDVEIIDGTAQIIDPNTVVVGARRVTAANLLIASGSWPSVPTWPGNEHVMTSNEVFHLQSLPRRVAVLGGGYIALEFAGIFHGLGVDTTVLYRGPTVLRGFDDGVRGFVGKELTKHGVDVRCNTDICSIDKRAGELHVQLTNGTTLAVDAVLSATGRHPNTRELGLQRAGVELGQRGEVMVDDYFRTNVPNIFAIGDVIDRFQLTPVALAEGMCVARTLFADQPSKLDYSQIPTAVFCQPNVATVGLTEEEARSLHAHVDVYETDFKALKHTVSGRDERTFMKLIVDQDTDRILGAHMAGEAAAEIIQGLAVALRAGATKSMFDSTIGIHPTAAEEFVTMREARPPR